MLSNYKHGMYKSPEYSAWCQMKRRCGNPAHPYYSYYGARGIGVCQRWLDSFQNFIADMGHRPTPLHTLERVDNSKGYSPENCCWAGRLQQQRNIRSNRMITFREETRCLSHWAETYKINLATLRHRLNRGWSVEDALLKKPAPMWKSVTLKR